MLRAKFMPHLITFFGSHHLFLHLLFFHRLQKLFPFTNKTNEAIVDVKFKIFSIKF